MGAVGVTGFPDKPFWLKESGKEQEDELQQEQVEVAGVFALISGAEEKLGEKAQAAISKLPIGHAAELMETVVSKGEAIKNPDRYVTAAVNRWEQFESEALRSKSGWGRVIGRTKPVWLGSRIEKHIRWRVFVFFVFY